MISKQVCSDASHIFRYVLIILIVCMLFHVIAIDANMPLKNDNNEFKPLGIDFQYLHEKNISGTFVLRGVYEDLSSDDIGYGRIAFLRKNGENIARAIISFGGTNETLSLSHLFWTDVDNNHIDRWSDLLSENETATFDLIIEMSKPPYLKSETFTVTYKNTMQANIQTPDQQFPVTFHNDLESTFTAIVTGGTEPYEYTWFRCAGEYDYVMKDKNKSSCQIQFGQLNLWGAIPVSVQVKDNSDNITFAQIIIPINKQYTAGDPKINGSGSRMVKNVNVSNGNFFLSEMDMFVPCKGISFNLIRVYNSSPGYSIGRKWHFNYDMKLTYRMFTGLRHIEVTREDGRVQGFFRDNDGKWYPINAGSFDQLVQHSDNSFSLFTKGRIRYNFSPPEDQDVSYLTSISDRDGNSLIISYTADSHLIEKVTDPCGREYIFEYTNGYISKVTDFTQKRYVIYQYDTIGRMTDFYDVRENHTKYNYLDTTDITDDQKLLTGIINAKEINVLSVEYDKDHKVKSINEADRTQKTSFVYTYFPDDLRGTVVLTPLESSRIAYKFNDTGAVIETIDWIDYQENMASFNYENSENYGYTRTIDSLSTLPEKTLITKSINKKGFKTSYDYYHKGNIKCIRDSNQRETTYEWITPQPGNITRNGRPEMQNINLIKSITSPGKKEYRFDYTETGNIKTITNPLDIKVDIFYQESGGLIDRILDGNDSETKMTFDDCGNLLKITDHYQNYTEFKYDDLGRVIEKIDKNKNSTFFKYDNAGNITEIENAYHDITYFIYDEINNLKKIIDPKNNITIFDYNSANMLTSIIKTSDQDVNIRSYEYDDLNRLIAIENENKHINRLEYDKNGRLQAKKNHLLSKISYTYDANGNILTMTDAEGGVISYAYDKLDRVVEVSDHMNNSYKYEYDVEGRIKKRIDPKEGEITYYYDDLGRIIEVKDSHNAITKAKYDENGNLLAICNPNGYTTTYEYDKLNRLKKMIDPKNRVWNYDYDNNSNLKELQTPDHQKTVWNYNKLNQVSSIIYLDKNDQQIDQVEFSYDKNGNRETMTDSTGVTTYQYDALNRLESIVDSMNHRIKYKYDGVGNMKSMTYPNLKTVFYSYDEAERLKTVTDWLNQTTSYHYNKNDQIVGIENGNGTKTQIKYNLAGHVVGYTNLNSDNTIISRHNYFYDPNGNIARLDADLPILPEITSNKTRMVYDLSNRILTSGNVIYQHDNAGRLISQNIDGQMTTYTYNALDMITQISSPDYNASFLYNGDGNRIQKTENDNITGYVVAPNGKMPYVISETDGKRNITQNYIYGNGLISSIDADNNQMFYHFDPTGNTIAITDADEKIMQKYAYTPFGELTASGEGYNPFKYVGKFGVMDDGNGLFYMRARYYHSKIFRFMSLDKQSVGIGDSQLLNQFAYVAGNPLKNIDPKGLSPECHESRVGCISPTPVVQEPVDIEFILKTTLMDKKDEIWSLLNDDVKILLQYRKEDIWNAISDAVKNETLKLKNVKLTNIVKDKVKTFVCVELLGELPYQFGILYEDDKHFVTETCKFASDATNPLIGPEEKDKILQQLGPMYLKTQMWDWTENELSNELGSQLWLAYIKKQPGGIKTHDAAAGTVFAVGQFLNRINPIKHIMHFIFDH